MSAQVLEVSIRSRNERCSVLKRDACVVNAMVKWLRQALNKYAPPPSAPFPCGPPSAPPPPLAVLGEMHGRQPRKLAG